jgi:hypothetical protein
MVKDLSGCSWPHLGILVAGTLIRFLYLDADPHYYDWVGYITDEGRWVQHARSLALYGVLIEPYLINMHFFFAPLFQLSNYLVFEAAGVSFLSSRMFTAFCGSAILVVFWASLRHTVSPHALLLGLTLLAFQTDLVVLSRVAVPEMAVMFFQLVIYYVIVCNGKCFWRMVSAGVLTLIACGMKATMVLFLPIFSVVIVLMPRTPADAQRWRDLALFWIGFTIPALVGGLVFYSLFSEQAVTFMNIGQSLIASPHFFGLSPLFLYNVISFPFLHSLSPTFNLWLLGVWLAVLGWLAGGRDHRDLQWHRYLTTAVTWFILYFFIMLSLEYFPTRYKVHVLLPLALISTLGISRIERLGLWKVAECFAETKGLIGFLWALVVSVPTAAFFAPLLAWAVAFFGGDVERMRAKAVCFVVVLFAISFVADRLRCNRKAGKVLLGFPLVAGTAWIIFSMVATANSFWPNVDAQYHAGVFFLAILVVMVLLSTIRNVFDRWTHADGARLIYGFAIVYLSISFASLAPGYIRPHYTIRDASRNLGWILSGTSSISSIRAESLFNDNKLRYRSFQKVNWPSEKPEILVSAFGFGRGQNNILDREYRPIMTYDLYVSPEYQFSGSNFSPRAHEGVTVTVYAKNLPGRQASQVVGVVP